MKNTIENCVNRIAEAGIDKMNSYDSFKYTADLHHHLYNEDYFIIGTYQAKQFLEEYGVFEAIGKVTEYEKDNFGEISTDLTSPEKVANMLAYVIGEELLAKCPTVQKKWDTSLTLKDIQKIEKELRKAADEYKNY